MEITFKTVAKRFLLCALLLTVTCLLVTGYDTFSKDGFNFGKSKSKNAESETEAKEQESEFDNSKYDDMSSYSICIDPAFGGSEYGNTSGDRVESTDNLTIALKVRDILKNEMNFNVYMTRESDTTVSDDERIALANNNDCDAVISLRRLVYLDANHAQGFESFIYTGSPDNSTRLSDCILSKLNETGLMLSGNTALGTARNSYDDYFINAQSDMASAVIFLGYVSSEEDNNAFDNNTDELARAVAEGIYEYIKNN